MIPRGFAVGVFLGIATWVIVWEAVARKQLIALAVAKVDEIIQNPPPDAPLLGVLNDPGLRHTVRDALGQVLEEKVP